MEMSPISGIRAVPAAQPENNRFDLPGVFAVPDPERSSGDTYNGKKASTGGQDDDGDLSDSDELEEMDSGSEELHAAPMQTARRPVDFFA